MQDLALDRFCVIHPGEREVPLDASSPAVPLPRLIDRLRPGTSDT